MSCKSYNQANLDYKGQQKVLKDIRISDQTKKYCVLNNTPEAYDPMCPQLCENALKICGLTDAEKVGVCDNYCFNKGGSIDPAPITYEDKFLQLVKDKEPGKCHRSDFMSHSELNKLCMEDLQCITLFDTWFNNFCRNSGSFPKPKIKSIEMMIKSKMMNYVLKVIFLILFVIFIGVLIHKLMKKQY